MDKAREVLERNRIGARLSPIYRGSLSRLKSSTTSGGFQQVWFLRLLRLIPLSGTQPRSGAVREFAPSITLRFNSSN
jgi:hypothetical protein